MFDLTSLGLGSVIAAGGVTALIASSWQSVRRAFSYCRSAIVLSASFDYQASRYVMVPYLKADWRVIPGGNKHLMTFSAQVKGHPHLNHILYDAIPCPCIMYSRKGIIIVTRAEPLQFMFIRGMVDVEDMVKGAYEFLERQAGNLWQYNRFEVNDHVGMLGNQGTRPGRDSQAPASQPQAVEVSSDGQCLSVSMLQDKPLVFESHELELLNGDPLRNLYYDPIVEERITHAEHWFKSREWYVKRGIPWRRGWLLHGPPGTGKSSLARAMAQKLRVPLNRVFLSTMSDHEFVSMWNSLVFPCVVLFEDFDNVFHGRNPVNEHQQLSFDTVLNHISGVQRSEGLFLIVTTNDLTKIDPAMGVSLAQDKVTTRPGRIDDVLYLGPASDKARLAICNRILCDWPSEIWATVVATSGMSPIQVEETCINKAFKLQSQTEPTQ